MHPDRSPVEKQSCPDLQLWGTPESGRRKLAWLSKDLWSNCRIRKDTCRQWEQGWVAWEENRSAIWMCRDQIRKAKACMEQNLVRDVKRKKKKKNKKGFYSTSGQEERTSSDK